MKVIKFNQAELSVIREGIEFMERKSNVLENFNLNSLMEDVDFINSYLEHVVLQEVGITGLKATSGMPQVVAALEQVPVPPGVNTVMFRAKQLTTWGAIKKAITQWYEAMKTFLINQKEKISTFLHNQAAAVKAANANVAKVKVHYAMRTFHTPKTVALLAKLKWISFMTKILVFAKVLLLGAVGLIAALASVKILGFLIKIIISIMNSIIKKVKDFFGLGNIAKTPEQVEAAYAKVTPGMNAAASALSKVSRRAKRPRKYKPLS